MKLLMLLETFWQQVSRPNYMLSQRLQNDTPLYLLPKRQSSTTLTALSQFDTMKNTNIASSYFLKKQALTSVSNALPIETVARIRKPKPFLYNNVNTRIKKMETINFQSTHTAYFINGSKYLYQPFFQSSLYWYYLEPKKIIWQDQAKQWWSEKNNWERKLWVGAATIGTIGLLDSMFSLLVDVPGAIEKYISGQENIISIASNIPQGVGQFYERQELSKLRIRLKQLAKTNEASLFVISGISASGKSELAYAYARDYKNKHSNAVVWYFDMMPQDSIDPNQLSVQPNINQLRLLLKNMGFSNEWLSRHEEDDNRYKERLWSTLFTNLSKKTNERWLFVFDNVADINHIKQALKCLSGNGTILITTQHEHLVLGASGLCLEELSEQDTQSFVKKYYADLLLTDIKKLSEVVGRLPLTLRHACEYIKTKGVTLDQYLNLYKGHQKKLAIRNLSRPMRHKL